MTSSSNYSKKAFSRPRISRQVFSRPQKAWLSYTAILALYALIFSFWQAEPVPAPAHCWGILIAALCLFPLGSWAARGGKGLPMFELICVAYLLAFGMPLYLQPNQIVIFSTPRYFSWAETQTTLMWSALGITAMISGFYGLKLSHALNSHARIDLPMLPHQRSTYFKLVLVPTLLILLFQRSASGAEAADSSAGAIVRLFTFQFHIAIVLLSYEIYQGRLSTPVWRFALFFAVTFSALLGLSTGFLEAAIIPLLLLFFVRWHVKGRFSISWVLLGAVFFLVFNTVKADYRRQVWLNNKSASISDRTTTWFNLSKTVVDNLTGADNSILQDAIRKPMTRFDLLHQFIWVQQMTPASVPFYEGFSYRYMTYGWVPRILWPDKPNSMEQTLILSHDYRFLSTSDTTTSLGVGHLPEAYANFGVIGIVIIMALQGMIFYILDHILNGPRSEGGRAIYLTIMIFFLNGIGSSTASLFLLIAPNVIANAFILYFFCHRWKAHRITPNSIQLQNTNSLKGV